MADSKNVKASSRERSRSPVPSAKAFRGMWLHPGQPVAGIDLCGDGTVVFEKDSVKTPKQGHWNMYSTTHGENACEVTFHHKGLDVVQDLVTHLFYEVFPGFYRMQNNTVILVIEKEFDFTSGVWMPGRPRFQVPQGQSVVYKNLFLWLRPSKAPAFLAITPDSRIIYVKDNEELDGAVCPEHGHATSQSHLDGEKIWVTHFHPLGMMDRQTTILKRITDECPVWRACGDCYSSFTSEEMRQTATWHVVMVQLA